MGEGRETLSDQQAYWAARGWLVQDEACAECDAVVVGRVVDSEVQAYGDVSLHGEEPEYGTIVYPPGEYVQWSCTNYGSCEYAPG
jgi:hypothetical protein